MIGDDYVDLADAILCGRVDGGETLAADKLQARYTVPLASWAATLASLR